MAFIENTRHLYGQQAEGTVSKGGLRSRMGDLKDRILPSSLNKSGRLHSSPGDETPQPSEAPSASNDYVIDFVVPEYPIVEKKVQQNWEIRPVLHVDIPRIASWFKDSSVREHVGEDRIDPYVPADWNNPDQVRGFHAALERFYFTPKVFDIQLKTPPRAASDGEDPKPTINPEKPKYISVSQYTNVCTINGIPVGVQSWLTDDPYAPIEARKKINSGKEKAAYGFVMITNPEFRRLHIATLMSATRADMLLGTSENNPGKFTQITGLVTQTEEGWAQIFRLFRNVLGYEVDNDPDGRAVPQIINGKQIEMWRMVLGRRKWWRIRDRVYEELEKKINPTEEPPEVHN